MADQARRDTTGTPSGSGTRQPIPQTEPTPAPPTRPSLTTLTSNDWRVLIETMKENNRGLIEELAPVLIQPRGDPIPKSSLAKPREFTGALSEYEAFRDEVLLYITGNPCKLDTPLKRILFTLSYLKSGQAEVWRRNWQRQRTNPRVTFSLDDTDTWEHFLTKLDATFRDPNRACKAMTAIQSYRQLPGMTAAAFFA